MTEREALVCQLLDSRGRMTPDEIARKTGFSNVESIVSVLLEKEAVVVSETLVERYRSKKETYVRLRAEVSDKEALRRYFEMVKGAGKQETMLLALIEMTGKPGGGETGVTRARLLERTGLTRSILSAMAKKGIVEIYVREINRFRFNGMPTAGLPVLSRPQAKALEEIHQSFLENDITLLHGVTSSGKTEIYMHLISYVLSRGGQALYLVPEIALTTQLTRRLQRVFGDRVVVYHSRFSDNERVDIWKRVLRSTEPCLVIGARSSVFLPFSKLGIVIVDEEHEPSYKQYDPAPRYNARDMAILLASMHGAKTLLGSATPSVETYYKATTGKFGLVSLAERYEGANLPEIEIIDTLEERKRHRYRGAFCRTTVELVREALDRGEQAILFRNRRGFAPLARCKLCSWIPKCEQCDVSLTYHLKSNQLVCHYCGATYPLPEVCPVCHEPSIEILGYGTERIEEEVEGLFPDARVRRMDFDTTRNKENYEKIIEDFSLHRSDILVGTQMVTKGLDFERVSLVGILNADAIINFPDFRSSERAFNMLEQVAGRAGRRGNTGRVVVQTSQPSHPVISFLVGHDYRGFYDYEISQREAFNYPPFTRLIYIYLKHRDQNALDGISAEYAKKLREIFGNRVSGPEEPVVSRVQSLYIRKIMLKIETNASMKRVKELLRGTYLAMHRDPAMKGCVLYYDVDPM